LQSFQSPTGNKASHFHALDLRALEEPATDRVRRMFLSD
jgi:hypothetical protein